MINLSEVGVFVSAPTATGVPVRFGLYLPGITPQAGYDVVVNVIHKEDHFKPEIEPLDFPLTLVPNSPNTLCQATVTIPVKHGTMVGLPGTYMSYNQLFQP